MKKGNSYELYCGDALEVLKTMPDNSINCCVTSPPYYNLRDYNEEKQIGLEKTVDEYIGKLVDVFHELHRVLTDDGTLWINIGDCYFGSGKGRKKDGTYGENVGKQSYGQRNSILKKTTTGDDCKRKDLIGIPWLLAFTLRADGWYLRQDIIWEKPNAMPESVKDRCTNCYEHLFMLSKSPKYYYNNEIIKENCINGDPYSPRGSKGTQTPNKGRRKKEFNKDPLEKRNKRNVWKINTKPNNEAHFATFPEKLVEPCILAGCPDNGTVIDIFSGSGTTGVVSLINNRKYIGVDLNPQYCKLQNERLKPIDNQTNLFQFINNVA